MIKKIIAITFILMFLMSALVMAQNLKGLQTYAVDKNIDNGNLTQSWNKLQIQDRERLQNMTQIQFKQEGNTTICEGKVQAKFLNLFQTQATQQFKLLENGSIEKIPKWYDWMFRYEGE